MGGTRPLWQVMLTYVTRDGPQKVLSDVSAQVPEWVEGGRGSTCCTAHLLCSVGWLWGVGVASPLLPTSLRVESRWIVGLTEAGGFWDSPNCDGFVV